MRTKVLCATILLGSLLILLVTGCGGGGSAAIEANTQTRQIKVGDVWTYTASVSAKNASNQVVESGTGAATLRAAAVPNNYIGLMNSFEVHTNMGSLSGNTGSLIRQDANGNIYKYANLDTNLSYQILGSPILVYWGNWAIGATTSGTDYDETGSFITTSTVVGKENVSVPAGTYEAWKIRGTSGDSTSTEWFVPQLSGDVKLIQVQPYNGTGTATLTYTLSNVTLQ